MRIDEAYRDWWENHLGNPPIPSDCTVVRVQNAIQGHPESPRLWEKLIDKILKSTGMNPTKHEPCLYQGMYHGHYTLFMRQVDDFAIATTSSEAAHGLIAEINKQLRLPIHILGTVTRFNGLDVTQTRSFVKISCSKYLAKLQPTYHWLQDGTLKQANLMLPFQTDTSFLSKIIHPNEVTLTESERKQLEDRMGIQYRKAMGEVMFPAVKCRPDVSPHVIILSQFMNNPQEIHYQALKQIMHYLVCTKDEGIYYWRDKPVQTLPNHPLPKLHSDTYDMSQNKHMNSDHIVGFVDSDWATITRKRTSMTGMIIMLSGELLAISQNFSQSLHTAPRKQSLSPLVLQPS